MVSYLLCCCFIGFRLYQIRYGLFHFSLSLSVIRVQTNIELMWNSFIGHGEKLQSRRLLFMTDDLVCVLFLLFQPRPFSTHNNKYTYITVSMTPLATDHALFPLVPCWVPSVIQAAAAGVEVGESAPSQYCKFGLFFNIRSPLSFDSQTTSHLWPQSSPNPIDKYRNQRVVCCSIPSIEQVGSGTTRALHVYKQRLSVSSRLFRGTETDKLDLLSGRRVG